MDTAVEMSLAAMGVSTADELLRKIMSGSFSDEEQELLVEVLTEHDMMVRDLIGELHTSIFKESHQCN